MSKKNKELEIPHLIFKNIGDVKEYVTASPEFLSICVDNLEKYKLLKLKRSFKLCTIQRNIGSDSAIVDLEIKKEDLKGFEKWLIDKFSSLELYEKAGQVKKLTNSNDILLGSK